MAVENAFNDGAMSERELQALEAPMSNESNATQVVPAEVVPPRDFNTNPITREEAAKFLNMEGGAITDDEYRTTVDAIIAMSNESNATPMAPVNPGAFSGVAPGQQIGASPDNRGATRGTGMQESGINPYDQNSMIEYIQRKADEIKGRMGGGQSYQDGSFENFLRSTQPTQSQTGGALTERETQMMRGNQ
tara:strand:+ start:69 stop:641 length:573 start_codon:yes stop_codon:yes gene_type:complete